LAAASGAPPDAAAEGRPRRQYALRQRSDEAAAGAAAAAAATAAAPAPTTGGADDEPPPRRKRGRPRGSKSAPKPSGVAASPRKRAAKTARKAANAAQGEMEADDDGAPAGANAAAAAADDDATLPPLFRGTKDSRERLRRLEEARARGAAPMTLEEEEAIARAIKTEPGMSAAERASVRRAKNKLAARRCRAKKSGFLGDLQATMSALVDRHAQLQREAARERGRRAALGRALSAAWSLPAGPAEAATGLRADELIAAVEAGREDVVDKAVAALRQAAAAQ
jgi:hypothetical protein